MLPDFEAYAKSLSITLSPSQMRFARAFFAGHNCCLTGEAGTGKSVLTETLFTFLTSHSVSVAKTALTGVAAVNIGGSTIYSFCGIGLADEPLDLLIAKVAKNSKAKARMRATEVLFIDEISMAKGDLLDKVDGVMRSVRRALMPFGGVQVVLTGDFCQLPPIFRGDEVQQFAFQSRAWKEAAIKTTVLKEQMRQSGDTTFAKVLGDIRMGDTSSLHLLEDRIDAALPSDGIEPVRIFCRNLDVDGYNRERILKLTGESKTYYAKDLGTDYHIESLNKNCMAPKVLELKVGAQVMLLTNLDTEGVAGEPLVNGSVGVVKAFGPGGVSVRFAKTTMVVSHNEWQIKEQEPGIDGNIRFKVVASRNQIPLKVCYAITAHKAQGQTLDRAIVDMTEAFAAGQVYISLSRVRDLKSLSITGALPRSTIRVNPECVAFYREAESAS